MAVDFRKLPPDEIHVRIINAYLPTPEGPLFASYQLEDMDEEDSYLFLLAIDLSDATKHRIVYQGYVVPLDHLTLSADRHFVLEMPNVLRLIDGDGLRDTAVDETEANLMRVWGAGGHVYTTGSSLQINRLQGDELPVVSSGDFGLMVGMQVFDDGGFLACGDYGTILEGGPGGVVPDPMGLASSQMLRCILRGSDGQVHLGGTGGVAHVVRDSELRTLSAPPTDLMALCEFQGQVYWGGAPGVMVEKDGALSVICPIANVYALSATADAMVAVTEEAAFVYDGATWRGFAMLFDKAVKTLEFDVSALNQ